MVCVAVLAACPRGGGEHPERVPLAPWHVALDTAGGGGFDAVAAADDGRVAATVQASAAASLRDTELTSAVGGSAVVMLAPGGAPTWTRSLGVRAGAIAIAGDLVVVAVGGTGTIDLAGAGTATEESVAPTGAITLRGEPGAALLGMAAGDGADRWALSIGATDWAVVRAITTVPGGDVVAVGSFAGTLRAGDKVVTSAGASDGFAVRVDPTGATRWLIRAGGPRADALTAAAAAPDDGLVIGGTFSGDAELRGSPLAAIDPSSIAADAFVALLDRDAQVTWAQPFGGSLDDTVAGVAVTGAGTVAAAATLRGDITIDGRAQSTRGLADAAVVTFDLSGHRRAVALVGGADYDTAAGLAALGNDLVVAASYSGKLFLGDTSLDGAGGDGALIAVLDAAGTAIRVHDLAGAGRETVAGLAAVPGGWVAAIRHTAGARVDDATLAAPADPYGGSAVVFRGE